MSRSSFLIALSSRFGAFVLSWRRIFLLVAMPFLAGTFAFSSEDSADAMRNEERGMRNEAVCAGYTSPFLIPRSSFLIAFSSRFGAFVLSWWRIFLLLAMPFLAGTFAFFSVDVAYAMRYVG